MSAAIDMIWVNYFHPIFLVYVGKKIRIISKRSANSGMRGTGTEHNQKMTFSEILNV